MSFPHSVFIKDITSCLITITFTLSSCLTSSMKGCRMQSIPYLSMEEDFTTEIIELGLKLNNCFQSNKQSFLPE